MSEQEKTSGTELPIHSAPHFYNHINTQGVKSLLKDGMLHPEITPQIVKKIQAKWRVDSQLNPAFVGKQIAERSAALSSFIICNTDNQDLIEQSKQDLLMLANVSPKTNIKQVAFAAREIILQAPGDNKPKLNAGGNILSQLRIKEKRTVQKVVEEIIKGTHNQSKLDICNDILR